MPLVSPAKDLPLKFSCRNIKYHPFSCYKSPFLPNLEKKFQNSVKQSFHYTFIFVSTLKRVLMIIQINYELLKSEWISNKDKILSNATECVFYKLNSHLLWKFYKRKK